MMKILCFILFLFTLSLSAQEDPKEKLFIEGGGDTIKVESSKDPLKASLYSAVMPGLGQVYNKQYWKVPIVWGIIGTGAYFIFRYDRRYKDFRNGFLASLNGEPTGYPPGYTKEILAAAQDDMRRDRDYAIAITTVLYAMNIIDAIVSAHLYDVKRTEGLAIKPAVLFSPTEFEIKAGIGINFNF